MAPHELGAAFLARFWFTLEAAKAPQRDRRRDLFLHCIGVRFALHVPWRAVRTAIWDFARARGLDCYVNTMSGRSAGIYFTKEGIRSLFHRGGITYVAFTPSRRGCYVVIKGFEDWFAMALRLVELLNLEATPRCEGVTCLEVAAMVREDRALRKILRGQGAKLRGRRLSLLVRPPEERRSGRRKIFVDIEIYRLGDPGNPAGGDDPPGVVKIEVRSRVCRGGRFTDHLSTDFDNKNHLHWLFDVLSSELLAFLQSNGLSTAPRTSHRSGLVIPKDFKISKENLPSTGRRPAVVMSDEAYLRDMAGQRRAARAAMTFTLIEPGSGPTLPPGLVGNQRDEDQAPLSRRREVFLTPRPSKLDPAWVRIKPGLHDARIQEAFVKALVARERVDLQLGLRLWIADGPDAGRVFPVLLHPRQWARLRELLRALGEATPGGVEPADLRLDWLIGRSVLIRIARRSGRPVLAGFLKSGAPQRAMPLGPVFGTLEQRARMRARALALAVRPSRSRADSAAKAGGKASTFDENQGTGAAPKPPPFYPPKRTRRTNG